MRLQSLHIRGFGKFQDFSMDFSEGFHVVHGLNESGKTTIHAFIEGMFYGFIDAASSAKRRKYEESLDKYRPAKGGPYGGSLVFEKDGRRYRIERTFGRKDADVQLFNEETGKDLSDELDIDSRTKLLDIAGFIDMPHPLYKNTLSVGQLSATTDETAADILFNRLKNLDATKTETFSVSRAIDHLEKKHEEIGKSDRGKRPYPALLDKKKRLEEECEEARKHHEKLLEESQELEERKASLETCEEERKKLQETIAAQENTKRLMIHERIEEEIAKARRLLEEKALSRVDIDPAGLERAQKDYKDIFAALEDDIDTLKDAQREEESSKRHYPDDNDTLSDGAYEHLKNDYERFTKFREQIERFDLEKDEVALAENTEELDTLAPSIVKKKKLSFAGLFASPLLLAAGIVMGILNWQTPFILSLALGGTLLVFGGVLFADVKMRLEKTLASLQEVRQGLVEENKKGQETIRLASAEIEKILERHKVEDEEAFLRLYYNAETKNKAFRTQREFDARKKELQGQRESAIKRTKPLLRRFHLPEDLSGLLVLRTLRDIWQNIERLLDKMTYKDFRAAIDFHVRVPLDDYDKNQEDVRRIEEEIVSLKEKITAQEAALEEKKKKKRDLSSIAYESEKTKEKISTLEDKKRRIKKAQKLLKDATEAIEETFSPLLRENIESYLPRLTKEHYRNIRIGKNLVFRAEHPATKRFETQGFFSTGTLDQIHLSIRLGVLKTLKKEDYPLFLDDAFVNFDDERLKNALRLFDELKADHQIILFTCQKRELSALEEQDIPHEVTKL